MFIFEDDGLGSEFKPLEQLNLLSEVAGLDQASMVYAWSQGQWEELFTKYFTSENQQKNFEAQLKNSDEILFLITARHQRPVDHVLAEKVQKIQSSSSDKFLVGFLLFQWSSDLGQLHLLKIAIDSHLRSTGLAQHGFYQALSKIKTHFPEGEMLHQVFLEVADDNSAAVRFYQKIGFKTLHLKKGYYSNGSDGRFMLLNL